MEERLTKWRLILGQQADADQEISLSKKMEGMDKVLEALYDPEQTGGLGSSSPNVNRWLGDIRKYFPTPTVQVLQKDALERLGLEQMLAEPELLQAMEPNVDLVATLLSLRKVIPNKTKETARIVVKKLVDEIEKKLKNPLIQAINGSIHRGQKNRRPRHKEIDWNKTIRINMKNYQKDLNTVIPEQLIGYGKRGQSLKKVILLVDQSGSMANSLVYAGILGAVMASIRSMKTHFVVFDTSVVDLTEKIEDPVDLLFGTQLGGGTDIGKALKFSQNLIQNPSDTTLVLISDLYEGGNVASMLKTATEIVKSGVQMINLLALSDKGAPIYDKKIAQTFTNMGVPTFACSPDLFPGLMASALKKENLQQWMNRHIAT